MKRTGGQLIVDCLKAQGVDRVFCVPGESYLQVLDALHGSGIDVVNARHEGGAAIMAEADGKLTGRPGVALVTRAPGATNASAGVHIAKQDSTPMILFVGQIGRAMRGRDAFQELDYRQTFGDLAKWVEEIDRAERIPEVLSHAWHVAMNGRPGPVVLALPEDMLSDAAEVAAEVAAGPRVEPTESAPTPDQIERLSDFLTSAKRPMLVLGGSRWTAEARRDVHAFAERRDLPVAASFRRQDLFDALHPNYAGDIGLGPNPALAQQIQKSDLLILLGARFSENPSQGFKLLGVPKPTQKLVHIHPGPEELGRIYAPDLGICATPGAFLAASKPTWPDASETKRAADAHRAYRDWTDQPQRSDADEFQGVDMGEVVEHLRETMPDDAIFTNGAGNYAIWLHRYHRYRGFKTQLAPTSGSMGYGLPAAVAAKLRHPEREVICFAGDGCFQMTGMELGAAIQSRANILILVIDNGSYGTIRMHQERRFPGRVSGTDLVNPDFAALARAFGAYGEAVESSDAFPGALSRARAANRPALLHIKTDVEALTPSQTVSDLRSSK